MMNRVRLTKNRLVPSGHLLWLVIVLATFSAQSLFVCGQEQDTATALRGLTLMNEGQALVAQGKTKSIHEGIKKYTEAVSLFHGSGMPQGEAATLIAMGMAYSTLEEQDNALKYLNQAIPLTRSLKEPYLEATALTVLGSIYSSSNQYGNAVSTFEQALVVLQGHEERTERTIRANVLAALGMNLVMVGEQKRSFGYFEQALALMRELKNAVGEAQVLTMTGVTYLRLGQSNKALEYDNRALAIARSVQDKTVEAMALGVLGGVYRDLGQNEKALELFNSELRLRQTIGDGTNISSSLNHIAAVYANMNDTANAFKFYKQALEIKRDSGTLNNLGELHKTVGEFQRAIDFYNEALSLTREENDRKAQAAVLTNIGALYRELGEPQTAIDYYKQALPLMQAMGSRAGEASIVGHIATVLSQAGRKEEALTNYTRALQLARGADRFGELAALINIGLTYSELGKQLEALDYYNRAMPIAREINDRLAIAGIMNNTGEIYRRQGQFKKALEQYESALAIIREVGDRSKEVSTLGNIAKSKRDSGDLAGARSSIQAALAILESLRTKVASQDLRASYFAKEHSYYEFEIALLMYLHKRSPLERFDLAALEANERSRARSLNELLIESRANIRHGVDPKLLERERSLQQQINAKAFARVKLDRIPNTAEQAIVLAQETAALINELQQVEGQIRQTSPRYAALTQPKPLDTTAIQRQLDSDTLLLEYSLGVEHSYLWIVSTNDIKSFELPAAKDIERTARKFIEVLHRPVDIYSSNAPKKTTTSGAAEPQAREGLENALQLSQMLFGPVASQLGQKRLVIVADGILQMLPFAVLPDIASGAPLRPMIVEHEIVSQPSISALATLRDSPLEGNTASKELLVVADPVFQSDDERVKVNLKNKTNEQKSPITDTSNATAPGNASGVTRQGGKRLERLLGSRGEAQGIAALLPASKVKRALDFEANRALLSSGELSQFRYLHFATHGLIDDDHPELTSIVLSLVDKNGSPQDGFYRAHEIYNLKLQSDLVVLSACDTGSGQIVRGEGLIGLTRGFMYAGARRVVVSLWEVTDESTPQLMVSFYRGVIQEKKRPSEALRAAQLEMLNGTKWRAPHYWAGFVLQGDWR